MLRTATRTRALGGARELRWSPRARDGKKTWAHSQRLVAIHVGKQARQQERQGKLTSSAPAVDGSQLAGQCLLGSKQRQGQTPDAKQESKASSQAASQAASLPVSQAKPDRSQTAHQHMAHLGVVGDAWGCLGVCGRDCLGMCAVTDKGMAKCTLGTYREAPAHLGLAPCSSRARRAACRAPLPVRHAWLWPGSAAAPPVMESSTWARARPCAPVGRACLYAQVHAPTRARGHGLDLLLHLL